MNVNIIMFLSSGVLESLGTLNLSTLNPKPKPSAVWDCAGVSPVADGSEDEGPGLSEHVSL